LFKLAARFRIEELTERFKEGGEIEQDEID